MTKQEIEDHKLLASQMSWDELAEIIMDLEIEGALLKSYAPKRNMGDYNDLIKIYEIEKEIRIKENLNSGYKTNPMIYGVDYMTSFDEEP